MRDFRPKQRPNHKIVLDKIEELQIKILNIKENIIYKENVNQMKNYPILLKFFTWKILI